MLGVLRPYALANSEPLSGLQMSGQFQLRVPTSCLLVHRLSECLGLEYLVHVCFETSGWLLPGYLIELNLA